MTYTQALQYLYEQLPMFHRIGAAAYKANLDNTIELCRAMHNPETKFPSVHIAGTNGKGSTSHFVASILQEAGYKTGLFTSPHLKDFRERIKINGTEIPKREVTRFIQENKNRFAHIHPSFFEWTFALACSYFAENSVDIAVIETGMGGRLDSTNVVKPLVSCITNIDFDHTQFLGNTRAAIATEKAGIIKPGIPVVIGESNEETDAIFRQFANNNKAEVCFADKEIEVVSHRMHFDRIPLLSATFIRNTRSKISVQSPLTGLYQLKNLKNVLALTSVLQQKGYEITTEIIQKGIRNVIANTSLQGRWQIMGTKPLCIADIGHNPSGIKEVLNQLSVTPYQKLHFVLGVVNDKDIQTMLSLLPKKATYYFCKADIPRGLAADELKMKALPYGLNGEVYNSVKEAMAEAKKKANQHDLILVGGSAFVVAEIV